MIAKKRLDSTSIEIPNMVQKSPYLRELTLFSKMQHYFKKSFLHDFHFNVNTHRVNSPNFGPQFGNSVMCVVFAKFSVLPSSLQPCESFLMDG